MPSTWLLDGHVTPPPRFTFDPDDPLPGTAVAAIAAGEGFKALGHWKEDPI